MDVDTLFPTLSSFVKCTTKRTLNQCGAEREQKSEEYWSLESSCWVVLTDQVKWRGGPHQILKTLDEFLFHLPPNTPTRSIKNKIFSKGSTFLDTVVEAAWAVHFWSDGFDVSVEQPLNPCKPKGKNADIVVTLDGIKHWLEVTSVRLSECDFPQMSDGNQFIQMRSNSKVIPTLVKRARVKYQEKFGEGVQSGLFKDEKIGILLCVFKSEKIAMPAFRFGRWTSQSLPEGLLDDDITRLNLVWVHTLNPSDDSDILQPWVFAKWQTK